MACPTQTVLISKKIMQPARNCLVQFHKFVGHEGPPKSNIRRPCGSPNTGPGGSHSASRRITNAGRGPRPAEKTSTRVLAAGTYGMASAFRFDAWGVLRAPCREITGGIHDQEGSTNGCDSSFVCRSGACRGILRRSWTRPSLHGFDHETHRANHDYPNRPSRV